MARVLPLLVSLLFLLFHLSLPTESTSLCPCPSPPPSPPTDPVELNLRPIIGVLTQPIHPALESLGQSYIAASYVKHLEGAGARVIAIHHNSTQEELVKLARSVNGILFPGGLAEVDYSLPFMQAARVLYKEALHLNQQGVHYPLWGTCLGFEMLMVLAAGVENADNVLGWFDAENITMPLNFTERAAGSALFGHLPPHTLTAFATRPITVNYHSRGVTPAVFGSFEELRTQYAVLSTNVDRKGQEFISSVEHIKLPFFAVQWHPEKVAYEWWRAAALDHSPASLQANHEMARVLVSHARRNFNSFASDAEEESMLISRYPAVYTYDICKSFLQTYVF